MLHVSWRCMELKEIIKILKNNLKLIVIFAVLGGLIAGGVIATRPVKYEGKFSIYLNKAPVNPLMAQNYNDFYSLQSLSNVADFLVEWTKGNDFKKDGFELQIKKRTSLYLEGFLLANSESKAKESFSSISGEMREKIDQLNGSIFAGAQVLISFSDINISENSFSFWRYLFAGIFGGLVTGVFAAFLKHYFKS